MKPATTVLKMPSASMLARKADELREILNLEDGCELSEITEALEIEREALIAQFDSAYLSDFPTILGYLL